MAIERQLLPAVVNFGMTIDRVVTQLLMDGTHQCAWLGIPASGKMMQIRMFTVRLVQGKIVED